MSSLAAKKYAIVLLKEHEGFRSKPYQCTKHKMTIGYGYNLEAHGYNKEEIDALYREGWTREHAERMLIHEIDVICAQLQSLEWWPDLDDARKAVCIDMAYQHGVPGFRKYKDTIKAIASADWESAAYEMRNSIWGKEHATRCNTLRKIMLTGVI